MQVEFPASFFTLSSKKNGSKNKKTNKQTKNILKSENSCLSWKLNSDSKSKLS